MAQKTEYLTTRAVRARGWSECMIRDLLGEPDAKQANPRYRSSAPMRLYAIDRVVALEETDAFRERRAKADGRRERAGTVAAQSRDAALSEAGRVRIAVKGGLSCADLVRRACRSYNDAHGLREDFEPAGPDGDEAFLARIAFNYARHELTRYDAALIEQSGRPGAEDARTLVRERVVAAILDAYPWLATAAEDYLERHREAAAMRRQCGGVRGS
jgi:hypothetical protein